MWSQQFWGRQIKQFYSIGFTLRHVLAVFTRSAMTPPKINQFGWNLEHSIDQHTVGGWPWHILGMIRTVATAEEPVTLIFPGKQRTISSISCWPNFTNFEHNTSVSQWKLSELKFENFSVMDSISKKKFLKKFNVLRLQAAITSPWSYRSPKKSLPK